MSNLCQPIGGLAVLFLWLSLLVALAETGLTLWAKYKAVKEGRKIAAAKAAPGTDWAKVIEALAKLLETLKGLPAWVAIFLAGLALLWTLDGVEGICTMS